MSGQLKIPIKISEDFFEEGARIESASFLDSCRYRQGKSVSSCASNDFDVPEEMPKTNMHNQGI
jgi:hypothetical protein